MARFFRRTKTDADTTDIDLPDSGASAPTRTPAPRSRSRARVSTDTSADGARNADSEAAPARRAPARKRAPRARPRHHRRPTQQRRPHRQRRDTPAPPPAAVADRAAAAVAVVPPPTPPATQTPATAPQSQTKPPSPPPPASAPPPARARPRPPPRPSRPGHRQRPRRRPRPRTGDAEADFVALIKHQTALLEQQTRLLQSLVDGAGASAASGDVSLKLRMALFVDVPNILYAAERSGVTVDWEKVQAFLGRGRTLVRSIAYAPISDDPDVRRDMERFVLPFLDKDYRIVTKPLKRFSGGAVKAKLRRRTRHRHPHHGPDRLDVIGLISGDGDFRRLVEIVSARGVRVEVVAFGHSTLQRHPRSRRPLHRHRRLRPGIMRKQLTAGRRGAEANG